MNDRLRPFRKPLLEPLSLSIVLPCFDEEANVEGTVRAAVRVGRRVAQDLDVVVVDDGSRDRTAEIAARLSRELPEVRVVSHRRNRGYGAALRRGFLVARGEWVFYTDGDGQFDIDQLPALLAELQRHDVVSGYRVRRCDGPLRLVNGRAWNWLVNRLLRLGLRDVNCAFKVYPRSLFDLVTLHSAGALVDAEVLWQARLAGLSIGEVGIAHRPRRAGRPTGGQPRVVLRAFLELGELLWVRARRSFPAPSAGAPPSPERPGAAVPSPRRPFAGSRPERPTGVPPIETGLPSDSASARSGPPQEHTRLRPERLAS